jgi:hypothetical protein
LTATLLAPASGEDYLQIALVNEEATY